MRGADLVVRARGVGGPQPERRRGARNQQRRAGRPAIGASVKLRPWLSFAIVLAGCAGTAKQVPPTAIPAEARPQTPRERLSTGLMQLAASQYGRAEPNLAAAKAEPALATQAELALSELFLLTGRAQQAIAAAQSAKRDSLLRSEE